MSNKLKSIKAHQCFKKVCFSLVVSCTYSPVLESLWRLLIQDWWIASFFGKRNSPNVERKSWFCWIYNFWSNWNWDTRLRIFFDTDSSREDGLQDLWQVERLRSPRWRKNRRVECCFLFRRPSHPRMERIHKGGCKEGLQRTTCRSRDPRGLWRWFQVEEIQDRIRWGHWDERRLQRVGGCVSLQSRQGGESCCPPQGSGSLVWGQGESPWRCECGPMLRVFGSCKGRVMSRCSSEIHKANRTTEVQISCKTKWIRLHFWRHMPWKKIYCTSWHIDQLCLFNNFYQQSICIFQFNLQVHHNCITGGCDKEARGCYDVRMGQLA